MSQPSVLLFYVALFIPVATNASALTEISTKADSEFYFKENAQNIAKYNAKEKLKSLCKKQGKVLYNPFNPQDDPNRIQYAHLSCKTNMDGNIRCKVQAVGQCIPKVSSKFNFSCGKQKKRIKGVLIPLAHGGHKIITRKGEIITLSPKTNEVTMIKILCGDNTPNVSALTNKMRWYFRQKIESLAQKCKKEINTPESTKVCKKLHRNFTAIGDRG